MKILSVPFIPRVLASDLVRKHAVPNVAIQSYKGLLAAVKKIYDDTLLQVSDEKNAFRTQFYKEIEPFDLAFEEALKGGKVSEEGKKLLAAEYDEAVGPFKEKLEEAIRPHVVEHDRIQAALAAAISELEVDQDALEAQFKYHNSCQERRRKTYASRCRWLGCTGGPRKNREAKGSRKIRRGQRVFCGSHSYIRHQLTKEQYQKLVGNSVLRVAV